MLQQIFESIKTVIDAETFVKLGYWAMTLIVFTETGLLIGFCLPGDSLLVTAGIFAARGDLDIVLINVLLIPAAILGDTVGYAIGWYTGPRLFKKKKSLLFNPEHLVAAHEFYERHGGKTIILARFMPIVRTFAPLVAGMAKMNYRSFLAYNVIGGIGWITSMSLIGYVFGRMYPNIIKKLDYLIVIIVFVSILPGIIHMIMHKLNQKKRAIAVEGDA